MHKSDVVKKATHRILPLAFRPLPLGAIRPRGWLKSQLRKQADGLTGHIDEFWPDVQNSAWIGGTADGWERGPYWLDGAVPLAFLLDDARLIKKVTHWIDYILSHAQPDGWLAPMQADRDRMMDPWPSYVLFKAMTQFFEATADARIIPAMRRCMGRMEELMDEKPLYKWGQFRWQELAWCVNWLIAQTSDVSLLPLRDKLAEQGHDWTEQFVTFPYRDRILQKDASLCTHGVNHAMALKAPAMRYRQDGDVAQREAVFTALRNLDQYHGTAVGMFNNDEHLAGRDPSQGVELCSVVEEMFSLEVLFAVLGDTVLADRLELIAFNALPATFKSDMCAHQYDQQTNQVVVKVTADERVFATNGPHATIFGLEPHFGCCLANMHQGWPKFTSSLWMATPDDGLVAMAFAPCTIDTTVGGVGVNVVVTTDYPFNDSIEINVTPAAPATFPLLLRIPVWADGASVQIGESAPLQAATGEFCRLERRWEGPTVIRLRLPMASQIRRGFHDSVIVQRGPLVYALNIGTDWKWLKGTVPFADWEVHPTTPWNYALQLDLTAPEASIHFKTGSVGEDPFSAEGAPVVATVKGRRIAEWQLAKNAAGPLPQSPVHSEAVEEELALIPYGSAKLRVTEFPLLATLDTLR